MSKLAQCDLRDNQGRNMRRKLRILVSVVAVAISGVALSVQLNGAALKSDMLLVAAARTSDVA